MSMKDITMKAASPAKYLMYVVYAIIIVVIAIVILKVIQAAKAGAAVAGDIAGQAIIAAQTGINASRQVTCKNAAQKCADATSILLHTVLWVSNEEVIKALNTLISPEEGKLTSQFYLQNTGFGLKSIVDKAVLLDTKRINAEVYGGLE